MSEYYDKNKFSGSQPGTPPPRTPPPPKAPPKRPAPPPPTRQQRQSRPANEGWWYSWPVIVILFAMGIWPVALGLLFYNIFQDDKQQKQRRQTASRRAAPQSESAAEQAIRRARERAAAKEDGQWDEYVAPVQPAGNKPEEQAVTRRQYSAQAAPVDVRGDANVRRQTAQDWASRQTAPKDKTRAPFSSKLLRIFGAILLFVGGVALSEAVPDVLRYGTLYLDDIFASMGFAIAGGAMFWRGHRVATMTRRSQRYILAIGNVDKMPIAEIAKRVNRTPEKAEKELQKLIDKGYLGEDAYIDHERGYFLRFGATLEEEPKGVPVQETPPEAEEGYSGILRNIRRANDRIADEELSRKIDRIEQVSALIFREVEEHPEKRDSMRTFFDYYLPTTQKLLDTYAEFEETGVEGENLRQAKERIEQTMDAIVEGFENQLDRLYSTDAMDVVSDIKVMEAMLNRDSASAAKDFGYAEPPKVKPKEASKKSEGGTDGEDGGITLQI